MRDILVTVLVFCSLPLILRAPIYGVLMWIWISVMNPHTQAWGFAQQFPFAFVIAIATLLSLLLAPGRKTLPMTPITVVLLFFVLWMNLSTAQAIFPEAAAAQWNKVMKIMLMTFIALIVVRTRHDVQRLVWMLVLSLGFYGVKGGLFTLRGGGVDRVWGPASTFIGDNNALALALIISIPLMYYLYQTGGKWSRLAMLAMMPLSAMSALASYSRGALLAIAAMAVFAWLRSGHRLLGGLLLAVLAPPALLFMPERWFDRMDSIGNYAADSSAQGRINAWHMAFNLARDRFMGGGFEISEPSVFAIYAPDPQAVHAAHSIYFQILGEHGFVGLGLYLLLGVLAWRTASRIIRQARSLPGQEWAGRLAAMIQASMMGFAVGGAFLSLAYFDVPYYLLVALVATRRLLANDALSTPLDTQQHQIGRRHMAEETQRRQAAQGGDGQAR
ncbi:putative O-glycosylation ligase, exosortase A system-associated [Massilia sp. NR 4-1]|uniref:putative O-glycosylation ligase, exosortase A system-associated n=1 Tax=Massilia sp. NR 4-1 TaxID=1678028 RepID=UPI00067BD147|nr:putative O-glycosylation ligase, exosortase A system-associated [Massilia sp. NR 4-1]AKU21096.1 polymerase [Massilia sp. NR 4-1]